MFKTNLPTSESFKKRSEKILGVFTKTKEELFELTQDQAEYRDNLEIQLQKLSLEKLNTEQAIQENKNIIKKIEAFLS